MMRKFFLTALALAATALLAVSCADGNYSRSDSGSGGGGGGGGGGSTSTDGKTVSPADKYRSAVKEALADGRIDSTERAKLDALQRELGLSSSEAQVIEAEAAAQVKASEAEAKYRDAVKEALADGKIDSAERAELDALKNELVGLDPDKAAEIETEEAEAKYRAAVKEALADGKIDSTERARLDALRDELGLDRDEALAAEAKEKNGSDAPEFGDPASFNYDGSTLYIDTYGIWWGDTACGKRITETPGQAAALAPLSWDGGDCEFRAAVTKAGAASSDIMCSISGTDVSLSCPNASVLTAGNSYKVAITASAGKWTSAPAEVTVTVIADRKDENKRYPGDPLYIDPAVYKYRAVWQVSKGAKVSDVYAQLKQFGLKEGETFKLQGKKGTASEKWNGKILTLLKSVVPSTKELFLTHIQGAGVPYTVYGNAYGDNPHAMSATISSDLYRKDGSTSYIINIGGTQVSGISITVFEKNLNGPDVGDTWYTCPRSIYDSAMVLYKAAKDDYIANNITTMDGDFPDDFDGFILYADGQME